MALIQDKSRIVIRRAEYYHLTTVKLNKTTMLNKTPIKLESLIGHKFGAYFQVVNKEVMAIETPTYEDDDILNYVESNSAEDTSNCEVDHSLSEEQNEDDFLTPGSDSGHVTKEEVMSMKSEGLDADEMIKAIAAKNSAFKARTDYSKTKYIKKKLNRHKFIFQVLKPNARLISKVVFNQDNKKCLLLSPMDIGHLLYKCNLFPGCRMILCEGTGGLLTSVILEKLGQKVEIIDFFTGENPKRENSVFFEFDNNCFANVYPLPFKYANIDTSISDFEVAENVTEPEAKKHKIDNETWEHQSTDMDIELGENEVKHAQKGTKDAGKNTRVKFVFGPKHRKGLEMYRDGGFDCLLIATKFDPYALLKHTYRQLAPSRTIVVFHSSMDVIQNSADWLSQNKMAVNIQVSEIFSRDYQVLPNRTRPVMKPEETAGYCLSAIKVESQIIQDDCSKI